MIKFKFLVLFFCFIFLIPLLSEESKVEFVNEAFIVENLVEEKGHIAFDLWQDGAATSVLEVFDKDGNRVSWEALSGDKKESDVIKAVWKNWSDTYKNIDEGRSIGDRRNYHSSSKSEVSFDIPEGGTFKISKSGDLAIGVNYATIALELIDKFITIPLFEDSISGEIVKSFTEELLKTPLLKTIETKSQNTSFGTKELLETIFSAGISVLKSGAIKGIDSLSLKKLTKAGKKLASNGISAFLTGAEIAAFGMNSYVQKVDLDYHRNNNLEITGYNSGYGNENQISKGQNNSFNKTNKTNSVVIKNSKIKAKTTIGKKAVIKNSNLGTNIKAKKVVIKNSTIKSKTMIGNKAKIINSNLGNEIVGKNVKIKNAKIISKTKIAKGVTIKSSNLGNKIKGGVSNTKISSNIYIKKGTKIKNSDFGVTLGD